MTPYVSVARPGWASGEDEIELLFGQPTAQSSSPCLEERDTHYWRTRMGGKSERKR